MGWIAFIGNDGVKTLEPVRRERREGREGGRERRRAKGRRVAGKLGREEGRDGRVGEGERSKGQRRAQGTGEGGNVHMDLITDNDILSLIAVKSSVSAMGMDHGLCPAWM